MWAKKIAPHMNVNNNASPSFRYFREKVRGLAAMGDRCDRRFPS